MRGLAALVLAGGLLAPAAAAELAPAPGELMLKAFFREQVEEIAARSYPGIADRQSFEKRRPELRAQLFEMMGLLPQPPRGDLHPVVTGVLLRPDLGIAVEKLHFQPLPGLYVTANLYRPLAVEGRLPAILYLCGHGQVELDGVFYGAKAHYQHHPAWFARNGYVCLIIDTLQNGEIKGEHGGTYRLGQWWWPSRGYTPAGVEAWSSVRALDYLEGRPEVDPARLGVTGRSGGGIGTWWLAALDDRPLALAPVAGITDLENHVLDGCIEGHCDCNFLVNLYRWDYPTVAALAAPRPLLFGNTDRDGIFPLSGVSRVHSRLKTVYDFLQSSDRLALLITGGPHADTQDLQVPVFRWMERWLRARPDALLRQPAEKLFDPRELKVFQQVPPNARNATVQEWMVPPAAPPEVPPDLDRWALLRGELLSRLRQKTFANEPDASFPLEVETRLDARRDGLRLGGWLFRSEGSFKLPLWVVSAAEGESPRGLLLRVVDEKGWREWLEEAAPAFARELGVEPGDGGGARAGALRSLCARDRWAVAVLPPRGVGPTLFSRDPAKLNQIRRRFLALGRTLEEAQVHDVRRAIRAARSLPGLGELPLQVRAEREMAVVALYAGLFESAVTVFDLQDLPASHRQAVPLLNVLRVLDIPQAVALAFPRRVILSSSSVEAFAWTRRVAGMHGGPAESSPSLLTLTQVAGQ